MGGAARPPRNTGWIGKDASSKKTFDCFVCRGRRSVKIEISKRQGTGRLYCQDCRAKYNQTISHIECELDVFAGWRDAYEAASDESMTMEMESDSTEREAHAEMRGVGVKGGKRKLVIDDSEESDAASTVSSNKKVKTMADLVKIGSTQPEGVIKIAVPATRKRSRQIEEHNDFATASSTKKSRTSFEEGISQPVNLTQEDMAYLCDASSDEETGNDGLEVATASERAANSCDLPDPIAEERRRRAKAYREAFLAKAASKKKAYEDAKEAAIQLAIKKRRCNPKQAATTTKKSERRVKLEEKDQVERLDSVLDRALKRSESSSLNATRPEDTEAMLRKKAKCIDALLKSNEQDPNCKTPEQQPSVKSEGSDLARRLDALFEGNGERHSKTIEAVVDCKDPEAQPLEGSRERIDSGFVMEMSMKDTTSISNAPFEYRWKPDIDLKAYSHRCSMISEVSEEE